MVQSYFVTSAEPRVLMTVAELRDLVILVTRLCLMMQ